MTKQQRRSKSQTHNRMKRAGFRWRRRQWWREFRFKPLTIRFLDNDEGEGMHVRGCWATDLVLGKE